MPLLPKNKLMRALRAYVFPLLGISDSDMDQQTIWDE